MTIDEFERIKTEFLQEMDSKLAFKRGEYADNTDVLRNFKRAAEVIGKHPIEVLEGYALKHEVSLHDLLAMVARGEPVSKELFLEKATDFANYLLLAYSMLFEDLGG